jgi:hypothetical protein
MKLIAKALLEAQKQMGMATKDSKNPFFKSNYADLNSIREACMPALNENGIVLLQPIVSIDGKNYVKTMLLHESGESIEGFTEIIYSKQNDAQAQGSGITYARRYGMQSLINVGAEDDDGNGASQPAKPQQAPTQNENQLPWLTESLFNQGKERLLNGELDVIDKIKLKFRMKKEYREELDNVLKNVIEEKKNKSNQ